MFNISYGSNSNSFAPPGSVCRFTLQWNTATNVSCIDVLHVHHPAQCSVQRWTSVCMYDLLMLLFPSSLDLPIRPQHSSPSAASFVDSALPLNLKCSSIWQLIRSSSTVHYARKPSMWNSCWTSTCRHITPLRYATSALWNLKLNLNGKCFIQWRFVSSYMQHHVDWKQLPVYWTMMVSWASRSSGTAWPSQ